MVLDFKDLLLTPIYLIILYIGAFIIRSQLKTNALRKYFIPAFTIKIVGAIAVVFVYQFYYYGGDTVNFFVDSKIIWEAFWDSPYIAFKIILSSANTYDPDIYDYTRRIYFFVDPGTYPIIRLSGFLGLFCFQTFTIIAILFSVISFTGVWALFRALYEMYPHLERKLAIAIFFLPSVFFWGSGLLKDTITFGFLGWLFYGVYFGIFKGRRIFLNIFIILISSIFLRDIKVYILMCFLPAFAIWVFQVFQNKIPNLALKIVVLPIILMGMIPVIYFSLDRITQQNAEYRLENIAQTTKTSAEWLEYVAETQGGSVYTLGEFDGTIGNLVAKFPQAVWLALYRPYLWEARNPLMLLSALETTFFLLLTIRIFFNKNVFLLIQIFNKEPFLSFCLVFTLIFAFAVAVNSGNFGTLVRYKIPFLPFFLIMLYVILDTFKNLRSRANYN